MKKIIVLLLLSFLGHAQTKTKYDQMQNVFGSNTVTIGSTDNRSLLFRTNGLYRLKLDSTGNLLLRSSNSNFAGAIHLDAQNTSSLGYSNINCLGDNPSYYAGLAHFNTGGGVGTLYDNNTGGLSCFEDHAFFINEKPTGDLVFATGTYSSLGERARISTSLTAFKTNAITTTSVVTIGSTAVSVGQPTLKVVGNMSVSLGSTLTSIYTNTLQLVDGNQGAGKVLTSNSVGVATWSTASGGAETSKILYKDFHMRATTDATTSSNYSGLKYLLSSYTMAANSVDTNDILTFKGDIELITTDLTLFFYVYASSVNNFTASTALAVPPFIQWTPATIFNFSGDGSGTFQYSWNARFVTGGLLESQSDGGFNAITLSYANPVYFWIMCYRGDDPGNFARTRLGTLNKNIN